MHKREIMDLSIFNPENLTICDLDEASPSGSAVIERANSGKFNQTPQNAASELGLSCLPIKRTICLYWLKVYQHLSRQTSDFSHET